MGWAYSLDLRERVVCPLSRSFTADPPQSFTGMS
jgi:hypothetical protein